MQRSIKGFKSHVEPPFVENSGQPLIVHALCSSHAFDKVRELLSAIEG
jgi:hypothetical protein